MKKRKNIALILVLLGLLILLAYITQPRDQWVPTWHENDRNPYGGYVLHEVMESMFPRGVTSEYRTIYELMADTVSNTESMLIISRSLRVDSSGWELLRTHVESGNHVMLSANWIYGAMADSLDFSTNLSPAFSSLEGHQQTITGTAREDIQFGIEGYPVESYKVDFSGVRNFISQPNRADTLPNDTSLSNYPFRDLAFASDTLSILRGYSIGQGQLYVSTTPLLFTNYHVLDTASRGFSAGLLSLFPPDSRVSHVEYYHMGRMENQTPLRFILQHPSLKMALWLTLIGLLLFVVFEARRKQRVIPVVNPPKNTSIEFAGTLGHLYYNASNDHGNMARKRIRFFLDHVRKHFRIDVREPDQSLAKRLIRKSEKDPDMIESLVKLASEIWNKAVVSKDELLRLEQELNEFYGIKKKN